jgi:hypothetical protein
MRDLNWEMKQLCERHVDGSYATQYSDSVLFSVILGTTGR